MSALLDIIIVAIIALTVYFAAKNGFVKTAISAVSFILAIVLTMMFSAPLADELKGIAIAETIEETTEDLISDIIKSSSDGISPLLNGESEEFNKLIKIAGLDLDDLKDWYMENVANSESSEKLLAEHIAKPIIDSCAMLLAIVIIFIGSMILLSIVACILNKVVKLPVLRTANKALGIVLGVILALFRVFLFCFVVNLLIDNAPFLDNGFIDMLDPENTLLFSMFSKIKIFTFFM